MDNAWSPAIDGVVKEEIVLSAVDTLVGYAIPVKLLTYPDGSMDLFRAQGNQFRDHLAAAKVLLWERGMIVGDVELMLPTGGYLPVWAKKVASARVVAPQDHRSLSLAPFVGYEALLALTDSPARAEVAAGIWMVS